MAPLDQYLMADRNDEIPLARSAAPASIADGATVLVLGPQGYTTAVEGTNGFLCYVERSWARTTDDPEFWNPKMLANAIRQFEEHEKTLARSRNGYNSGYIEPSESVNTPPENVQ